MSPADVGEMTLEDLGTCAVHLEERRELEEMQADRRFLGVCMAIRSVLSGGFDPAQYFPFLLGHAAGPAAAAGAGPEVTNEDAIERELMKWCVAAGGKIERPTKES